jgi:hypothetical protein
LRGRVHDEFSAQAVVAHWGTDGRVVQAQQVLDWLARTKSTEFTARDLQRSNGRQFSVVEDTRGPLELLMERGWIRPMFEGPLVFGGRGVASPLFAVNPCFGVDTSDTSDTSDNSPSDQPKVSDMSDVSPRDIKKGDSLTHSIHKETGPPVDMSDMSDNSNHWSGLL